MIEKNLKMKEILLSNPTWKPPKKLKKDEKFLEVTFFPIQEMVQDIIFEIIFE